jgi:hypothetical protein
LRNGFSCLYFVKTLFFRMKPLLPRLIPFCALLLASPARAEVPPFKHGSINIYPAAGVAAKGSLAADGNLNDWKPGAFVSMMADPSLRDQFSLRLALAYDAKNLYVAARFRDSTPLLNRNDPRIDPFKAWNGDALQLRFVTDAGVTHPVPGAAHNSDKVVHLTAWQFTMPSSPRSMCGSAWTSTRRRRWSARRRG